MVNPTVTAALFATWCRSLGDGGDHAVADEAIAAEPGRPTALCGTEVVWCPMEWAPGPRCEACLLALREAPGRTPCLAAAGEQYGSPTALPSVVSGLRRAIPFRPIRWIARRRARTTLRTETLYPASSNAAVTLRGDRTVPPAETWPEPVVSAGAPAGEGTDTPVPSPAQFAPDTVSVTGVRRSAAQTGPAPSGPGAPLTGLGGHQLPAAAHLSTSAAIPDGRDTGQQDARPRRCVLLTQPPIELPIPATATAPIPTPR